MLGIIRDEKTLLILSPRTQHTAHIRTHKHTHAHTYTHTPYAHTNISTDIHSKEPAHSEPTIEEYIRTDVSR